MPPLTLPPADSPEAVYRAHAPGVRAWLAVRAGAGADDLTGDAFVAVLAALPSYAGEPEAFGGWVYALVRETFAERLRGTGPGTAADEVRALLGAGLSGAAVAALTGRSTSAVRHLGAAGGTPPPPVPPEVAERHLARLAATRAAAPPGPRRHRVRAVVATVVVAAALVSGAGVAVSSPTRPGAALYGFKTARERIQLAMARPGDSRAHLELRLGRTRLREASDLFRAGEAHRAVETLARADASLAAARAQGSDRVDAEVTAELDRRIATLRRLLAGDLTATVRDAVREALDRALARR